MLFSFLLCGLAAERRGHFVLGTGFALRNVRSVVMQRGEKLQKRLEHCVASQPSPETACAPVVRRNTTIPNGGENHDFDCIFVVVVDIIFFMC